jgi:hypothetical protein
MGAEGAGGVDVQATASMVEARATTRPARRVITEAEQSMGCRESLQEIERAGTSPTYVKSIEATAP